MDDFNKPEHLTSLETAEKKPKTQKYSLQLEMVTDLFQVVYFWDFVNKKLVCDNVYKPEYYCSTVLEAEDDKDLAHQEATKTGIKLYRLDICDEIDSEIGDIFH